MWIDQICINQPDTHEKEQQVSLMSLIYTHATNAIIWLGDEDGQNPGLGFETMEFVYIRLQKSDLEITPDDFERLGFPPAGHQAWLAITTQPKDKIYGVLGITRSSIVPDYSPARTARDVYQEAFKQRITLLGIVFDTITTLGDVIEEAALEINDPRTKNQSWASNIQLIGDYEKYPSPTITIYDAFSQILVAGRDASSTAAPTKEHSEVFSIILDSTTGQMPSLLGKFTVLSARNASSHFTVYDRDDQQKRSRIYEPR
ncbi:hypothetical protein MMC25_007697, partial [Agyrium rufum]|nr:hypothetical protein [Agyrium rufum]